MIDYERPIWIRDTGNNSFGFRQRLTFREMSDKEGNFRLIAAQVTTTALDVPENSEDRTGNC